MHLNAPVTLIAQRNIEEQQMLIWKNGIQGSSTGSYREGIFFFQFEFNLIKKKKTLSKSLFFGQYSPFLCFLSCGCQATGQQFFFDFASAPQGWREEGDTVKALWGQCVPTPGLVAGWPPAVLMSAPPDGRRAEAPHGMTACGQSLLPFSRSQSGAAHSEA